MEKQRILIVDDDENIAELISLYLVKECFATEIAYNGKDALRLSKTYNPHLILLDIMLPDIDGYEVCTEIRKTKNTPIIMLSAKGEVFDKVLGLKIGADDYMIKPFDSNELVARVKAVLRRTTVDTDKTNVAIETEHQGNFVEYDGLLINITNYTVTFEGRQIEMPPKELELLYFLAKKPNQVFTRDQLLDTLWGYAYIGDSRTVDVHIKRLREKLNENHNWSISTVWGKGYKFEVR
ncbi:MAG: response regulator transcription factor [Clostridium sp.]|nr:response regulator transcription factor [Clostridium sp.]MCM1399124.1 response regulator transcription factor [Clostridium sp.]MCM1459516.1 response regulator transcription factor [Bacteroides sp.]